MALKTKTLCKTVHTCTCKYMHPPITPYTHTHIPNLNFRNFLNFLK